jgi:SAM-dependent methyltransferase
MSTNYSHNEKTQRNYYNQISDTYDAYYGNPWALTYRYGVYDRIIGKMDFHGKHVLDAMCGGGMASRYFVDKGAIVSGVDISDEQCRHYRQRFPTHDVRCESILQTTFNTEQFDFIVTDSLHHLHPQVPETLNEMIRILKPGGHILAYEPNARSFMDFFRKIWYRADQHYFENNEHSIDIHALIKAMGGRVELEQALYGGRLAYLLVQEAMVLRVPSQLIPLYSPLLMRVEFALDRMGMGRLLSAWVVGLLRKVAR